MHKFWMNLLQRLGLWGTGQHLLHRGAAMCCRRLPQHRSRIPDRMGGGEQEAKSVLIERNLRLVVYIARRFGEHRGEH